ncbi:uncharacterized protein [Rutidosis leptorrhynchoides]|uniref:uncharacterized protein n=1 Tax=Rutidosis leptorrhynchoides TaxID=125765 RepID=UPI003A9950C8
MGHLRSKVSNGVNQYWRPRGYKPLAASTNHNLESKTNRSSWRIRIASKLKIKLRYNPKFNPKKLVTRFRRAYVSMMMKVANSPAVIGGVLGAFGSDGDCQIEMRQTKEYDEKLVIQMYNSLVMRQAQLAALKVEHGPQITCFE